MIPSSLSTDSNPIKTRPCCPYTLILIAIILVYSTKHRQSYHCHWENKHHLRIIMAFMINIFYFLAL